ncbi:hypothetical protein P153DRAFT_435775 [Dothidotthia symphoricarpi CBS 119687]|uniref:Uncharacterized protein n=1 Tax=Dothidotthia symphoricarpi CBS 119687 TaxID=1392245 RepID=A0A6A5ZXF3_9PLEO|nr:uncharacterized protein P153DRAFT_435775 [Dothidotthia symphoricarpi CBS 119687]KAF2123705.1 hypothetical protein P153DRAFT_435775 [Dothidotthia symphoricarpi CBS 119687]
MLTPPPTPEPVQKGAQQSLEDDAGLVNECSYQKLKGKLSKIAQDDESDEEAEVHVPLATLLRSKMTGSLHIAQDSPPSSDDDLSAASTPATTSPFLESDQSKISPKSTVPAVKPKERPPTMEDLIAEGRWITENDPRRRLIMLPAPTTPALRWRSTINTPRPSGG